MLIIRFNFLYFHATSFKDADKHTDRLDPVAEDVDITAQGPENYANIPEPSTSAPCDIVPHRVLFPREQIQTLWDQGREAGAGFVNIDNTCYMNASIQALFAIPAFSQWIRSPLRHFPGTCLKASTLITILSSTHYTDPVFDLIFSLLDSVSETSFICELNELCNSQRLSKSPVDQTMRNYMKGSKYNLLFLWIVHVHTYS